MKATIDETGYTQTGFNRNQRVFGSLTDAAKQARALAEYHFYGRFLVFKANGTYRVHWDDAKPRDGVTEMHMAGYSCHSNSGAQSWNVCSRYNVQDLCEISNTQKPKHSMKATIILYCNRSEVASLIERHGAQNVKLDPTLEEELAYYHTWPDQYSERCVIPKIADAIKATS